MSERQDYLERQIGRKIDQLGDVGIRGVLSQIFSQQDVVKNADDLDASLVEIRDAWPKSSSDEILPAPEAERLVGVTLEAFRDYFSRNGCEVESRGLMANSDFAGYMIGHIRSGGGNANSAANTMYVFCDYLCRLSLLPIEQQKIGLESFPPSREYLACIGGSMGRIQDLFENIDKSTEVQPFVQAHKKVLAVVAQDLKDYVMRGNHTHIPAFFDYASGVRSAKDIHPQSQIPSAYYSKFLADYLPNFKEGFLREIRQEVERNQEEINAVLKFVPDIYPGLDLAGFKAGEELFKTTSNLLSKFEIDGQGFFKTKEVEGGEPLYFLDLGLLSQAALNLPALKILDSAALEFAEKLPEVPKTLPQKQLSFDLLSGKGRLANKALFSRRASSDIVNLLKIADSEVPNPKEILLGLETLWALGDQFAGGSPLQFVKVVNSLNAIEPDYLNKKIRPIVEKFLPNQLEKIDRVNDCYDSHVTNQSVVNYLAKESSKRPQSFGDLLLIGAPTEDVLKWINDFVQEGNIGDAINQQLRELLDQSGDNYAIACRKLVFRPDFNEIMKVLEGRLNTSAAKDFVWHLVFNSVGVNEVERGLYLLSKFVPSQDQDAFLLSSPLQNAAANNSAELVNGLARQNIGSLNSALEKLANFTGLRPENNPIYIAAASGSAKFLLALHESNVGRSLMDKTYRDALKIAAESGHANVISAFSKMGYDLNQVYDPSRETIAHIAARNDRANVIDELRIAGVGFEWLNFKNRAGSTPLTTAVGVGSVESIKSLYQAGVTADTLGADAARVINVAIVNKKLLSLRTLVDLGFDLNCEIDGRFPIHNAVSFGDFDLIVELKRLGADLDLQDWRGKTSAHFAVENGNPELIKLLIKLGADFSLSKFLADNGEELECGISPICLIAANVVEKDRLDLLSQLPLNKKDQDGNAPVHQAILLGSHVALEALISAGGGSLDLNQENEETTPLNLAAKKGNIKILTMLCDNGVKIDSRDKNGRGISDFIDPKNNGRNVGDFVALKQRQESKSAELRSLEEGEGNSVLKTMRILRKEKKATEAQSRSDGIDELRAFSKEIASKMPADFTPAKTSAFSRPTPSAAPKAKNVASKISNDNTPERTAP
ncbi:MAG: ankyrin repeat domain-containing protein [Rickettsiales bacterium]|nr:ankyrin repeat domain-containing protein [Rickettsiales bacterium]